MEKVTIIILTYNREKLLRTAIKSVLNQSYSKMEILVVDGSSDDKTPKVLKEFKGEITVIEDTKKIGVSAARNLGIKRSTGDYITFLDDDDFFHPKKIERQIKIFKKEEKLGVVYCPLGRKINNNIFFNVFNKEKNVFEGLDCLNDIWMTPLVKRECFSVCGLFDESLLYHEDRDMWYRIHKEFTFGFHNFPDYIWYVPNIPRLSSQMEKICKSKIALYEKHKNDFEDKNRYFSNLYCELASIYFNFGDYANFLYSFKKSIILNPYRLPKILKKYSLNLLGRANPINYLERRKIRNVFYPKSIFSIFYNF